MKTEEELREAFESCDSDGSGVIDGDEVPRASEGSSHSYPLDFVFFNSKTLLCGSLVFCVSHFDAPPTVQGAVPKTQPEL
eukprot:SAG11_NODE_1009_length_6204_cov_54.921149_4_plen_80_part_00